jgi:hypothetical protein
MIRIRRASTGGTAEAAENSAGRMILYLAKNLSLLYATPGMVT